jgi:cyclin-dependent kinase 12/13
MASIGLGHASPAVGVGSLSDYRNLSQIGEGGYGYVYRALDVRGQPVALKRMIIHKEHLGFPLCAVREIKFLKQLRHKNIVQLKDIVTSKGCEQLELTIKADSKAKLEQSRSHDRLLDAARQEQATNTDKSREREMEERVEEAMRQQRERVFRSKMLAQCGSLYLVFEYVEHDLGGLIDAKVPFQPRALKSMMKQIFEVLDYLEERHIIHRDIKCSNILVSHRHQIKLADFGLARSAALPDGREGRIDMTNNVVTRWYKAPELLLGSTRYTYAVDVWSVGCVLAELYLERPLFQGSSEPHQLETIFRSLGSPSEQDWPGLLELPHYDKLFKHAPRFASSFRAALAGKVPEAAASLLDRVFVMDPSRRCSARAALTSMYFITAPLAPDDPTELEPLQVTAGANLHEYATKQRRKEKEREKEREATESVLHAAGNSVQLSTGASMYFAQASTVPVPPPPYGTGHGTGAGYAPPQPDRKMAGGTGTVGLPLYATPAAYGNGNGNAHATGAYLYAPPGDDSGFQQHKHGRGALPLPLPLPDRGNGGAHYGGAKRRR